MLAEIGTRAVTQSMVNDFKHVSEWATAAYCKPQQGKSGGKSLVASIRLATQLRS